MQKFLRITDADGIGPHMEGYEWEIWVQELEEGLPYRAFIEVETACELNVPQLPFKTMGVEGTFIGKEKGGRAVGIFFNKGHIGMLEVTGENIQLGVSQIQGIPRRDLSAG